MLPPAGTMPGSTIISVPVGRSITLTESEDAVGPAGASVEETTVAVGMTVGVPVASAAVPGVAVGTSDGVSVVVVDVPWVTVGIVDGVSEAAGVPGSPSIVGVVAAWP